jgi:hypothetical protein
MVDLRQLIEFFNDAAADLPEHARLKGRKLPSITTILDGKSVSLLIIFCLRLTFMVIHPVAT